MEILARLEKLLDARSSEPWSHRRLPASTATFPVVIYSKEDGDNEISNPMPRDNRKSTPNDYKDFIGESFLQRMSDADQAVLKQVRALRKKLQQIEVLESKQHCGHLLDGQQIEKLQTRPILEAALAELGAPLETDPKLSLSGLSDEKGNKKANTTKKQRRKSAQKAALPETLSANNELNQETNSVKGFPDGKSFISKAKVSC